MPVIIKDITDDEAAVIMVDSTFRREAANQRKGIPYKVKYEALKRQERTV